MSWKKAKIIKGKSTYVQQIPMPTHLWRLCGAWRLCAICWDAAFQLARMPSPSHLMALHAAASWKCLTPTNATVLKCRWRQTIAVEVVIDLPSDDAPRVWTTRSQIFQGTFLCGYCFFNAICFHCKLRISTFSPSHRGHFCYLGLAGVCFWAWKVRCLPRGRRLAANKKLDSVQLLQRKNGSKKGNVDTQTWL